MADGSNRGSGDAMSSQGSDEVFYNVVDEVGDSSHSDTSGESVVSAISNLEEWNRSTDDRVRLLSIDLTGCQNEIHHLEEKLEQFSFIFQNQQAQAEKEKAELLKAKDLEVEELHRTILGLRNQIYELQMKPPRHGSETPIAESVPIKQIPSPWPEPSNNDRNSGVRKKERTVIEVRDIGELTFDDVHSIHAKTMIQEFMQMVKQVGNSQKEWCSIAYARMDKTLKLCVHSEMRKRNLSTIEDVENILLSDFDRPKDAAQAFHQLRQLKYSLDDDPRDFVNTFNAKFKSISNAFPSDEMPVADEAWRDIIMDSLPRDIKVRLNRYLRGGMAQMFLNELEKERGYYNRGRVAKLNNETPVRQDAAPRTHHKPMPYPCGWCQNGSRHSRANCPREPAPYSCFDCLAPGTLKGHPGCPGFCDSRHGGQPQSN